MKNLTDVSVLSRYVTDRLESANSIIAIRALHKQVLNMAQLWSREGLAQRDISQFINDWHNRVLSHAIKLSLEQLRLGGIGSPPVPFSWMSLGSGGRQEQTLFPDQDHALVYEDPLAGKESAARHFFRLLGEKVTYILECVGYPLCTGNVMATNARWNLPKTDWLRQIDSYLEFPDWDNARFLMLSVDARHVFGERKLFLQMQDSLLERLEKAEFIHWQIADRQVSAKAAIDFWGSLRTNKSGIHEGSINIKEGGYLQIVNAVRVWAVANGIKDTPTMQRLDRLQEKLIWEESLVNHTKLAFTEILRYRLWGNYVKINDLTAEAKANLKEALTAVKRIQKITVAHFHKPR